MRHTDTGQSQKLLCNWQHLELRLPRLNSLPNTAPSGLEHETLKK